VRIAASCERVYGDPENLEVVGADAAKGGFFPSLLYYCDAPFGKTAPHDVEAFGPVNTVMPYRTLDEAVALAKLGRGSLCGSVVTADDVVAREVVLGTAAYHGRLMVLNRHNAKESTGRLAAAASDPRRAQAPAVVRRWAASGCRHCTLRAARGPRSRRSDGSGSKAAPTPTRCPSFRKPSRATSETWVTHPDRDRGGRGRFAGISGDFFCPADDIWRGLVVRAAARPTDTSTLRRRGNSWTRAGPVLASTTGWTISAS
jgi:oxepin-CoA hydrolase/3-oxo-5,6-dehydrosuberyl-CoA semialdehyde dehydrogenase